MLTNISISRRSRATAAAIAVASRYAGERSCRNKRAGSPPSRARSPAGAKLVLQFNHVEFGFELLEGRISDRPGKP